MNTTAHLKYNGDKIYLTTPFDAAFVTELKARVKSRKWDPSRKQWVIDLKERAAALAVTRQFYTVIEENQPPAGVSSAAAAPHKSLPPKPVTTAKIICDSIQIWTDGACAGNPGPGGYGIIFDCNGQKMSKSGGFKVTTNNRMEIMAAIVALETIQGRPQVVLFSDSQYLVNAMTLGWARKWRANGWMRNSKDKAVNPDLWERLLKLCEGCSVEFKWLRGHNAQTENEWCDQLAVAAAQQPGLPVDSGYRPEDTGNKLL